MHYLALACVLAVFSAVGIAIGAAIQNDWSVLLIATGIGILAFGIHRRASQRGLH